MFRKMMIGLFFMIWGACLVLMPIVCLTFTAIGYGIGYLYQRHIINIIDRIK